MLHELVNPDLRVLIKPLGAELTSIRSRRDDLEYLWQGDPAFWAGQSYILFPIVGGLPDGGYRWHHAPYRMKPHGFARNSEFELLEQTKDRLTLRLNESDATLAQYPFRFELLITYALDGNRLLHGFTVINRSEGEMPFSIGGHPGFRCPLLPGEEMSDYRIEFECAETLASRVKTDGLLTGQTVPFLEHASTKPLTHDLFRNGAAILNGVKSNWLEIRNERNPHVIRVDFSGFPDLGIWSSANNGPFVCIEPWFGYDSAHGDAPDFEQKKGLLRLAAGKTFSCAYTMTFN